MAPNVCREYPLRPVIGVGAVVVRGDDTLLVRRTRAPRAGEWSLPGGRQRLGERVFETAVREVAEETGVTIRVHGILDVIDLIDRDPRGTRVRYHYTLIDVLAEWIAGDAAAASDAAAAVWVSLDALPLFRLWSETERLIRVGHARWRDLQAID